MSLKPYDSYRASGIEWLGDVPAHWNLKRIKITSNLISETALDCFNPIALENIQSWTGRLVETASEFQSEGIGFKSGDILFGKLRPYLAKVHAATGSGEAIGDLFVIRPGLLHYSKFLFYQLVDKKIIDLIDSSTYGARMPRVSWEFLGNLSVAVPPLSEQSAIAAFLDRETAKVDALVAEQERLIDLLKEKRQAVISHAVTKGLDPAAPMKDSGVEWLGDIPAHWEVGKFVRYVSIAEGQVDPRVDPYLSLPLIAPNHVESGTGRLIAVETAFEQGADSGKYAFEAGAVIYSKIRPSLAKAVIAPFPGLCSADMYPLRTKNGLRAEYLLYVLISPGFTAWATLESDRVAMPKINREKLNELRIPVPPSGEQIEIFSRIEANVQHYDELIAQSQSAIDVLKERREALISAAVTGKIDVRGLVAGEKEAA